MADRFEQMVVKITELSLHRYASSMEKKDAVTLLRREHAAVVRLVKKVRQCVIDTTPIGSEQIAEHIGYIGACDDILAALAKRKGTP